MSGQQPEQDFNAVLCNAWIETRMEHDKSLLTVASFGVGLMATLAQLISPPPTLTTLALLVGFAAFLTTIVLIVIVFRANSGYLERLRKDPSLDIDPVLERMDSFALGAFLVGMVALSVVGIAGIIG